MDPRRDAELDQATGFLCENALCVPLEGEEAATVGAIALYNKRDPAGFSGEDTALLRLIAANASTAIRLQEARESREREDRLRQPILVLAWRRLVALRVAPLPHQAAGMPFTDSFVPSVLNGDTSPHGT